MWLLSFLLVIALTNSETIPVIFDNDADYDDILAAVYLTKNPLFDVKAWTITQGFATPYGSVPNMQRVAKLLGVPTIPVAYGSLESRSPVTNFPPQWRVDLDQFFASHHPANQSLSAGLPFNYYPPSEMSAVELIVNTIHASPSPVLIIATGPFTNIAEALERDRSILGNIRGIYFSGTAFGPFSTNNVYDWQMDKAGGCPSIPVAYGAPQNIDKLCRGYSFNGTEWNVFLDVRAWHEVVLGAGKQKVTQVMCGTGCTGDLVVEHNDPKRDAHLEALRDRNLAKFLGNLFEAFTMAGEAKWWDAVAAVLMAEKVSGTEPSFCTDWWTGEQMVIVQFGPEYGKVIASPYGATVTHCLRSDPTIFTQRYWSVVSA